MTEMKKTIQILLSRTISLIHAIEESEDFKQRYPNLLIALKRISSALQKSPVDADVDTLGKATYYIFRTFDGPLHNEIEQEAYDLVGEIGLLRRKLKEKQGKP